MPKISCPHCKNCELLVSCQCKGCEDGSIVKLFGQKCGVIHVVPLNLTKELWMLIFLFTVGWEEKNSPHLPVLREECRKEFERNQKMIIFLKTECSWSNFVPYHWVMFEQELLSSCSEFCCPFSSLHRPWQCTAVPWGTGRATLCCSHWGVWAGTEDTQTWAVLERKQTN